MSRGTATTTMSRRSTTRGADEGDGGRSSGNRAARRAGRRRDAPSPRASPSRRASPSSPTTTNGRMERRMEDGRGGVGRASSVRARRSRVPSRARAARSRVLATPPPRLSPDDERGSSRDGPRAARGSSRVGMEVAAPKPGLSLAAPAEHRGAVGRTMPTDRVLHAGELYRQRIDGDTLIAIFPRFIGRQAVRPRRDPTVRAHVNRTAR